MFQTFISYIGYNQDFKAKEFRKTAVSGLWTVVMHFVIRGLSGKHGGTDTLRRDWLNVVFRIYSGRSNVVDLLEVLCQDFCKFSTKRKEYDISSPRFWALTIQ